MKGLFKARRSALIAFSIFAVVAAIGVPINALYFQDGHHPAPLFHTSASGAGTQAHAAYPPAPPLRPTTVAPAKATSAKSDTQKIEVAKLESAHPEKPHDAISQLLEGSSTQAAEPANKSVLFAQRALAKLGYPLRPDGVFGGSTRQAIEKFERSAGMPVKGELTPKILRQLTAKSKLPRE